MSGQARDETRNNSVARQITRGEGQRLIYLRPLAHIDNELAGANANNANAMPVPSGRIQHQPQTPYCAFARDLKGFSMDRGS